MEINTLIAKKLKEALDPVGQEDDDLDNDRKKNTKSDKYLKNRRKAISIAIENEDEDECEECGKSPCECENDDDDKNEDEDKSKNNKKSVKETYSNWREDLVEISNLVELNKKSSKINDTKVDNYKTKSINLSPELKESVEELGGILLETYEVDCEPQDIFEDFLDAEIYLLDDYTINYVVEDVICELLDEGYELDYITDTIIESIDHSLFVLNEATAADARLNARAANRAANRAAIRSQTTRLSRKTDRLSKIKTAAKNTAKAISYGTGYAAGAGVRAAKGAAKLATKGAGYAAGASVRAAKGVGSQLAKGYEAGRKKNQSQSTQDSPQALSGSSSGSGSTRTGWRMVNRDTFPQWQRVNSDSSRSSGSSASSSGSSSGSGRYRYVRQEPKQKNIAQRLGDSLRRLVARGARATSRGARNLARAVDVKEDFILESIDIASQYFYEQGYNSSDIDLIAEGMGYEQFVDFIFDIGNTLFLDEAAYQGELLTSKGQARKNPKVSAAKGASTPVSHTPLKPKEKKTPEQKSSPGQLSIDYTKKPAPPGQERIKQTLGNVVKSATSPEAKKAVGGAVKSAANTAARVALSAWQGHKAAMERKKKGGSLGQQLGAGAGRALGSFVAKGTSHLKAHVEFGDWLTNIINEGFDVSEWTISELYSEYEILVEKSVSEQQQKLFGLALSVKRGQTPRSEVSAEVLKIVDSMSEKEIRKYAKTKHEGIPKKVQQEQVSPEDVALAKSGKIGRAADQMQKDINDVLSGKKNTFGEPEKKRTAKRVKHQFTDMSNNTTQGRTSSGSRLINADMSQEDDSNEKNPEVESQTKKMKAAKINDLRTRLAAAMKGVY